MRSRLEDEIRRLGNLSAPGRYLHDGPGGRVLGGLGAAEAPPEMAGEALYYDVVTIGGWSHECAWMPPREFGSRYETVNDFFGEMNHVFAAQQTAEQVNAGSWSWGRGDTETYFAIAAIVAGTRSQIPVYIADWWNRIVPSSILRARSIGASGKGGPVALALKIGVI